jgi:hypothetical protein
VIGGLEGVASFVEMMDGIDGVDDRSAAVIITPGAIGMPITTTYAARNAPTNPRPNVT